MQLEQEFIEWASTVLESEISTTREPFAHQNVTFKLSSPKGIYFLKIGKGLEKERARLDWLNTRQPVPQVIAYTSRGEMSALLLSAIEGENLRSAAQQLGTDTVIDILVEALHTFHATDVRDCPFGTPTEGLVLVHGDACLPNFIVKNTKLSGFIDLEDMRIDREDVDLAAAVWSLQYNFGPGLGMRFLEAYGVENPTDAMVEQLRLQYEKMMKAWDAS